ncbi:homoserine O-acetyltransferase MetX [Marininema halotolerans]|uniref:Homoserine O-acetyltransferase n=1 Tax=Marininema halotolerans TaxID=1155944 RepID=A0A1I6S8G2_9BACL|nr:homoserine O-acetyltransferase [Marininema halotolerans]SFS73222.1 homoserine O-acetyltransferase [Marininema halotolerans]
MSFTTKSTGHHRIGVAKGEGSLQRVSIGDVPLDSGVVLPEVEVVVETAGSFSADANNAVLVCHALTGDAHAVGNEEKPGWWRGLIGPQGYINTEKWFVITMNVLGGCNGTTGPTSINPQTGKHYRSDFPYVSIRDMVRVQKRCLDVLGISYLHAIIGGSMGGMMVLEWGLLFPECVGRLVPIATASSLTPTAIAYNDIGRQAIVSDPDFKQGNYDYAQPPTKGLAIARMMGMITYRTNSLFEKRFSRALQAGVQEGEDSVFQIESYLRYQGRKLAERFDANSYLRLLKAMDTHDLGWGRGGVTKALRQLQCPVLVIGFQEDILFPIDQQRQLYQHIQHVHPSNQFLEMTSEYGHDAFLIEFDEWGSATRDFLG